MISDAPEGHKEGRLVHLAEYRCDKAVLTLFQESHNLVRERLYATVVEIIREKAVNTFFTGGVNELLDKSMYKLVEAQDITPGVVRHLSKLSIFTVPIKSFV